MCGLMKCAAKKCIVIVLNNSHNIPIGKWEPMICDWETNDFKEYRKSVDYEVIGNIFDNPELLESEG